MSVGNPVRKLNAETARKIAAGEVIDRPNAIVRELMDNAIDSGATGITVEISGGGIEKIRVVDNGCGMTRDDLTECAHPHCTSKIAVETDLLNLSTLGFRGEALASIAAVARLSIISGGYKMRASITEDHIIEPVSETTGTIVMSEGLFENFPARRQFLKRPASEGVMCRQTFIEKSLPRPDLAFRLVMDGETKIDLQAGESQTSRFVRAMGFRENEKLFYEIEGASGKSGAWGVSSTMATRHTDGTSNPNVVATGDDYRPDWKFRVVLGEPSVNRTNKKDIYIFVNGRRIQEYSLVQAVEYGGQGYFPNGTYPVAAVFVEINPKLVDFNIHPAKKEARFSDLSELHHALSSSVKNFYKNYTIQNLAANALQDEDVVQQELSGFSTSVNRPQMQYSDRSSSPYHHSTTYSIPSHETPHSMVADSNPHSSHERYTQKQSADFRSRFLNGDNSPNTQNVLQNPPKSTINAENVTQNPNSNLSVSSETEADRRTREQLEDAQKRSALSFFSTEKIAQQALDSQITNSPLNPLSSVSSETEADRRTREQLEDAQKRSALSFFATEKIAQQALDSQIPSSPLNQTASNFKFLGSCLGTFLVAEKNNSLYIIDQHAAHERILFNKIMAEKPNKVPLIIPYELKTESETDDEYLESIKEKMDEAGFEITKAEKGCWEVNTTPDRWKGTESDLREAILSKKVDPADIIRSIAAMTSCKAAVKDHYILDDITAGQIAEEALTLPDPHCPHGRPIYHELTREQLFGLVRRTE